MSSLRYLWRNGPSNMLWTCFDWPPIIFLEGGSDSIPRHGQFQNKALEVTTFMWPTWKRCWSRAQVPSLLVVFKSTFSISFKCHGCPIVSVFFTLLKKYVNVVVWGTTCSQSRPWRIRRFRCCRGEWCRWWWTVHPGTWKLTQQKKFDSTMGLVLFLGLSVWYSLLLVLGIPMQVSLTTYKSLPVWLL